MFEEEPFYSRVVANGAMSRTTIPTVFDANRIQRGISFGATDDIWIGKRQDKLAITPDTTGIEEQ